MTDREKATVALRPLFITWTEAHSSGLTRYFTGKPCPQGHICERTVANMSCVICLNDANKARHAPGAPGRARYLDSQRETNKRGSQVGGSAYIRRITSPRGSICSTLIKALKRHSTVDPVTIDELLGMWERQEGRCAVTGVVMTWTGGNGKVAPTSMSIDRIDSGRGYTKDNVQLVTSQYNSAKGNGTDEECRQWILACASYLRRNT